MTRATRTLRAFNVTSAQGLGTPVAAPCVRHGQRRAEGEGAKKPSHGASCERVQRPAVAAWTKRQAKSPNPATATVPAAIAPGLAGPPSDRPTPERRAHKERDFAQLALVASPHNLRRLDWRRARQKRATRKYRVRSVVGAQQESSRRGAMPAGRLREKVAIVADAAAAANENGVRPSGDNNITTAQTRRYLQKQRMLRRLPSRALALALVKRAVANRLRT